MLNPDQDYAVSVIIPCYNHGQFLLEAIASVENEPEINCQLIVVNDGSTSSVTLEILDELRSQNYHILDIENQGLSQARNYGIQHASAPYILPLDADNKLEPGFLKAALSILKLNLRVGVVYGDRCIFGQQEHRVQMADFSLSRLLLGNYIDACALFRRQVWIDVGGYDPEIPDQLGYEDWDFWLGAVETGWQFSYLDCISFRYRSRPGSMVSSCNLPENRKRLFQYICSKHYRLYGTQFAEIFSTKEAQRLQALDEVFRYSEALSQAKVELAITQQERDRNHEENQILRQQIQVFQSAQYDVIQVEKETEIETLRKNLRYREDQIQYWKKEHTDVLNELNKLRQIHHEFLKNRWWRMKAKVGKVFRILVRR